MADASSRNARLDQLQADVTAFCAKQTAALNQRVTTAKAILQGRTGSSRLAQSSVQATSDLVVASINDFLAP